jgi:ATP-dependent DNA helicase UvrD/PcrA
MPWSDGMIVGSAAYAIAASTNPRIRVVAGPGTGKSFAVKRRVARLLESGVRTAFYLSPSRVSRRRTCTANWSA